MGKGKIERSSKWISQKSESIESLIPVKAKDNDGKTALMYAAEKGQKETVELLLAKGADINAKDKYGKTALMYAARKGYKEIVELLLAKGADINAKDKYGKTALDYAKGKNKEKIVEYLKQAKAKK